MCTYAQIEYLMDLETMCLIFLILFSALASFDGIVLHLWKYKLYKYSETFYEHQLHSIRASIFPFVLIGLFLFEIKGWLYAVLLLAALIDLIVQVIDMWEEKEARIRFGGLSSAEYILHVTLTSLHSSMLLLYLIAKPTGSVYFCGTEIVLSQNFRYLVAINLLPGAIFVSILHLVLCLPNFRNKEQNILTVETR